MDYTLLKFFLEIMPLAHISDKVTHIHVIENCMLSLKNCFMKNQNRIDSTWKLISFFSKTNV